MLAGYRGASEFPLPLPSAGDIHVLPSVRDTLLDGTDEEFAALKSDTVSRLPQLTNQYYEERRTALMELLPEGSRTRDALFLAQTSFICKLCNTRGMGAQEAMRHICGCFSWGPAPQMSLGLEEHPWSKILKGLSYCGPDVGLKKEIILAVGEDPATITNAGMDLGNHRFLAYLRCIGDGAAFHVLSWRGLVSDVDLLRWYD